jgi:multimeric flavodoxin WrbA
MRVLVLNGSPRKSGTVSTLLHYIVEGIPDGHEIEWIEVCTLDMVNTPQNSDSGIRCKMSVS